MNSASEHAAPNDPENADSGDLERPAAGNPQPSASEDSETGGRDENPDRLIAGHVRIKICGLTLREDALHAARSGADFLGLVLVPSPRRAEIARVREWTAEVCSKYPSIRLVGVFVRPSPDEVVEAVDALHLDLVQIHGRPADALVGAYPVPWILAVGSDRWSGPQCDRLMWSSGSSAPWALLVDSAGPGGAGGTGRSFDWHQLRGWQDSLPPRLFLAGGLGPDNVAEAIRVVRPYAVDASSRLEVAPGRKDPAKVAAFIAAVRGADTAGAAGE